MKKFFVTATLVTATLTSAFAQTMTTTPAKTDSKATPAAKAKTEKVAAQTVKTGTVKGRVVLLQEFVQNGKFEFTKDELNAGKATGAVVLMAGTPAKPTFYFVVGADGGNSTAELIAFSGKEVVITGRTIARGGVNYLIASKIAN